MEKEFTLKSELVRDDVDRQMVYLVRRFTDLSDEDMGILLEMAHSRHLWGIWKAEIPILMC